MLEIERKYVARITDRERLRGFKAKKIRQGYLATGPVEIRIRESLPLYLTETPVLPYVGIKFGDGLVRREIEFPVDATLAEDCWTHVVGDVLVKTRYFIPTGYTGARQWELDVFEAPARHADLVLLEIELEREDMEIPAPPPGVHILYEVTEVPQYRNQALAVSA